jgi:hypothetical protein
MKRRQDAAAGAELRRRMDGYLSRLGQEQGRDGEVQTGTRVENRFVVACA